VSDEQELSTEIVDALEAGRKVEAIKMLRVQRGLGLAEAKEQVDLYIAEHPQQHDRRQQSGLNLIPLIVAAAIAVLAYFAFENL
jgi:hypothetical protein